MNITHDNGGTIEATDNPLADNLYNRLDEKTAVKLDAIATKYPTIHRGIKSALQNEKYAINLRFETVSEMSLYLGIDINFFYSYFK